jgi:hypothetical protein
MQFAIPAFSFDCNLQNIFKKIGGEKRKLFSSGNLFLSPFLGFVMNFGKPNLLAYFLQDFSNFIRIGRI